MSKLRMAIQQAINKKWPSIILYRDGTDATDALEAVFQGKRVRYDDNELVGRTLRSGVYHVTRDIDIGKRT